MRKDRLYVVATLLLTGAVLNACSADDASVQPQSAHSNIISLTSSLAATRAASDPQTTQLNTAVEVGVFGVSGLTTVSNGSNARYAVKADGSLTAKVSTMEWPTTGSASLYAYAPYQSGWALNANNVFTISKDQSTEDGYLKSDLLYGMPVNNPVAQTDEAVQLKFRHLLTKMAIKVVKAADDDTDFSKATLTMMGTKIATTVNLATGTLGEATGEAADIKVATSLGDWETVCIVVVPQTIAAGTELVRMVLGDKMMTAKLSSTVTLESGKAYSFTFNMVKAELCLGSISITDWATGADLGVSNSVDETGNVESDFDGNATEPARISKR